MDEQRRERPTAMTAEQARVMLRMWAGFVASLVEQRRDRFEAAWQAGLGVAEIREASGSARNTVYADLKARGIEPPRPGRGFRTDVHGERRTVD